jgi:AN1-like Zinc finger
MLDKITLFIDYVGRQIAPDNYCTKCKVKLGGTKEKIKCEWCGKYYCLDCIPALRHSKECQKRYLKYRAEEKKKETLRNIDTTVSAIAVEITESSIPVYPTMPKRYGSSGKKLERLRSRCAKCRKKFGDWTDAHECRYCGRHFCSDHWVPETHDCTGNPERPLGGFREVHHANGNIDISS